MGLDPQEGFAKIYKDGGVEDTVGVEDHVWFEDRWMCRMDLPGPTTSVGTRTDYSVGPWDYPACATRHLRAWSTRTTQK
jgi:hypothetical protein